MIAFTARILKFDKKGEKTGWTYIEVPAQLALKLKPGNKKSFRVKGTLDRFSVKNISLLPMGGGDFIMPLNATMRKGTGKRQGAMLKVQLEADNTPSRLNEDFMECLCDEPAAKTFFEKLPLSHRNYFNKWIESAKTESTRTRRIAQAVTALGKGYDFGKMLREARKDNIPLPKKP